MKYKPFFSFLIALFFAFTALAQGEQAEVAKEGVTAPAAGGDAALAAAGDALYKNNCASCHALDEVVVGPALRGVDKKHSETWLINWIRNSSKMVQSGDKEAVKIFNEFQKQQMPSFAMSDEEIKSILAYIKTAPAGGAGAEDKAAAPGAEGAGAGAGAASDAGKYLDLLLVILVVVLIVMVITLVIIATVLSNYLKKNRQLTAEDEEVLNQRFDIGKILKSKAVRGLALTIFVVALLNITLDKVLGVGIQQHYQPKQPIAFSHKLHAGDHKIDCNYCHTSVYKGKNANIPSANICMNCHSQIKKESAEIKKIYTAIEKNRPIEWVRIHNLPDLSYFNHSQHTKVGGVECQTCHGPIETMEVVYQYSPLTMGWCINCHRETPLNTQGNAYYDNLVKLHDSENSGKPFTVSSNGGTECSKCHY
ncbi:c-type cytochrome [Adhaeribacter sp. BT258]|uniref:C-type cytochrome n=1 Tax=Adhaeribacter terrigena TaxID=2793070 RepID=A0ABS1BYT0_9BACT|nr:c-type cytochrome [Adhaeribacter terrigena]MBK0402301.1 c-type cytochrome [Adhaeribacter terrigena]